MANAAFFSVGMVALYGLAYGPAIGRAGFWQGWVAVAIALSVATLFGSPKLKYADSVLGARRLRWVLAFGTAVLVPMLVGVWRYAARLG